jgi:replicative DNA helicase
MTTVVVNNDSLKAITSQFEPGYLVLVAGRPSTGKTSFILDVMADNRRHSANRIYYQLELSKVMVGDRLSAIIDAGLKTARMNLESTPRRSLAGSEAEVPTMTLFLNTTPVMRFEDIATDIITLKKTGPVGLVAIDYLQLMNTGHGPYVAHALEGIVASLKATAVREKLIVILVSQLKRNVDDRPDHKPQLSDLGEFGQIEQFADIVLLLSRSCADNTHEKSSTPSGGDIRCHVARNRNGSTWETELYRTTDE